MNKWMWLVCLGVHGIITFGIYVYYDSLRYPQVMLAGIGVIILLDIVTFLRQNSKSYSKEVGEYDYNYDNFPTYTIILPIALYCFQTIFKGIHFQNEYVVYMRIVWTIVLLLLGVFECIRVLSNFKIIRPRILWEKHGWFRIIVSGIITITFCFFVLK